MLNELTETEHLKCTLSLLAIKQLTDDALHSVTLAKESAILMDDMLSGGIMTMAISPST